MEKKAIIQVQDLRVSFGRGKDAHQAVKGISFSIAEGETLAIVGESGSGKSVSSLALMGLLPRPSQCALSGDLQYYHEDRRAIALHELSDEERRKYRGKHMAMIFQEPMTSLNPVMTCGEQVAEALRLHKKLNKEQANKRVLELFREVQLPVPEQMLERYPHQLSGGQKQRVMIAMALSCEPRLLIADEPTTALDVTVQKTILELLRSLQTKYRMGILFITHDLGVVAELADRVMVMFKGTCLEEGEVKQIFRAPAHPYTKSLLACKPPLDARPERLPVVSDFVEQEEGHFVFWSSTNTVPSARHVPK